MEVMNAACATRLAIAMEVCVFRVVQCAFGFSEAKFIENLQLKNAYF